MKRDGFTLVEMAIVLVIIGLAAAMILPLSSSMLDAQKRQTTGATLSMLDAALANFVAQNRRLPCPALGTIASGAANAGVETLQIGGALNGQCNPANQAQGVVPWVTLGLSETAANDPWKGRITYRVYSPLAMQAPVAAPNPLLGIQANQSGLMDMSACDPAAPAATLAQPIIGTCNAFLGCTQCYQGAACTTANIGANCVAPTTFIANKGLPVSDGNGNWLNNPAPATSVPVGVGPANGAAYILISAGPSGAGAYNSTGSLQPGAIAPGISEGLNENNNAIKQALPANVAQSYRDAPLNDVQSPLHFDDYLSHPTVITVLQNANLGSRAH